MIFCHYVISLQYKKIMHVALFVAYQKRLRQYLKMTFGALSNFGTYDEGCLKDK